MEYLIIMTRTEKKKLKEKMPHKWADHLVKKTGFSKIYIQQVMCGMYEQDEIEEAALNIALEYQKKIKKIKKLQRRLL